MKIVADQNIPCVEACFEGLGEVTLVPGRAMTAATVADADVLLVRSVTRVDASLLDGSRVRFVGTATIGVDHVDQEALAERGIGFASAPGSNAESVAEWWVAALLTVARRRGWTLAGRRVGIVGVGNVGSRVRAKCRALGMEVCLNDPPLARQTGSEEYRSLEEAADCDIVTFHTPLTRSGPDATAHLAGRSFFDRLKPGAVFVNSSRGGVHDTAALHAALDAGRLGALILDVWENEPTIDVALLERADIATPHIAGYSTDGKIAGLLMIYEACCRHFGLEPGHRPEDFLPAPPVPRIDLPDDDGRQAPEETVHEVVRRIYDIEADDARLRGLTSLPPDEQGTFFDTLRKTYPVRREFHNTVVSGPASRRDVLERLAGLGFGVETDD